MRVYGWYASACAAEPFIVSAVSTYVPLLLADLARHIGVRLDDKVSPCVDSSLGASLGASLGEQQCVVKIWKWYVDSTSLPLYVMSVSIVLQIVFMLSVTGIADRTQHSKFLLIALAMAGGVLTIMLGSTEFEDYIRPSLLFILASGFFGAMNVCANAFLPKLATSTFHSQQSRLVANNDRFHGAYSGEYSTSPSEDVIAISSIGTDISSKGAGSGYVAALVVHIITIYIVKSTHSLSTAISFIGWWWLLGQGVVFWGLDENELLAEFYTHSSWSMLLSYGWTQLLEMFRHVNRLKDISIFLIGWFLLSDGLTTINSTAILFARTNLEMETSGLAIVGLITILFAIFGAFYVGPKLDPSKAMITIALAALVIPLYGILGFVVPYFGLKHACEMYILAIVYGTLLGAVQTISRALYATLIPESGEAIFFAFFAVTGKGSSVLGPIITGMITDYTHNIRYAFYFLFTLMALSAYTFSFVDYNRGRQEAADYVISDANEISIALPENEM